MHIMIIQEVGCSSQHFQRIFIKKAWVLPQANQGGARFTNPLRVQSLEMRLHFVSSQQSSMLLMGFVDTLELAY